MSKNNSRHKRRKTSKPKLKIMSISKTILAILKEGGEITIKSFFPHPYYHLFCHHYPKQNIHSSLYQLHKRGLIKKNSNRIFYLTAKGEEEAFWSHLNAKISLYKKPVRPWDGYWRMILFDIPEKKRRYRDWLRQVLKTLDFKELQRSIWVTPHQIPDFLKELLQEERIKHFVRFVTIKEIDYDQDLKKMFKVG